MQELIKQTVLRLRSEAVSAQSYQRKAADLIESQAAEIAKYKALCDQMVDALEIAAAAFWKLDNADIHAQEAEAALEAWRAMK